MNKIRQHNDQKKKNRQLKIEQYDPTKNRILDKSNTMGATSGAGTAYPSRAHE